MFVVVYFELYIKISVALVVSKNVQYLTPLRYNLKLEQMRTYIVKPRIVVLGQLECMGMEKIQNY